MTGYFLAFIGSIFFSLYVVPRKLSKLPPLHFSLLMGLGFFISSVILYLFKPLLSFDETINPALLWAVVAGVVWAIGFVAFVKSIDLMGLARSNQWKNLQGPIGVILTLIILGEYTKTNPAFALLAGGAIFISALFFTITDSNNKHGLKSKGVYLAVLSGFAFGIVTVFNKYITDEVGVYSQQVVWSLFIFLTLLIYLAFKKQLAVVKAAPLREKTLGLVAGIIYLGASFFMLQSYRHIPASIGFTIIQLNAIWTIALGIFVFKEINVREHYKKLLFGFLFTIAGIALLALARK